MIRKTDKKTGSDYTATVTRVEGNTAYVKMTGADIDDTPVALSIDAKPGDSIRVRVNNGKAWITGNDTAPPTNDADTKKDLMTVQENVSGLDRLIIKSKNFSVDASGNAVFSGKLKAATGTFNGEVSATAMNVDNSFNMHFFGEDDGETYDYNAEVLSRSTIGVLEALLVGESTSFSYCIIGPGILKFTNGLCENMTVTGQTRLSHVIFGDANHYRKLVFQNDGNMVIYDANNNALWSSGTNS